MVCSQVCPLNKLIKHNDTGKSALFLSKLVGFNIFHLFTRIHFHMYKAVQSTEFKHIMDHTLTS